MMAKSDNNDVTLRGEGTRLRREKRRWERNGTADRLHQEQGDQASPPLPSWLSRPAPTPSKLVKFESDMPGLDDCRRGVGKELSRRN